MAGRHSAAPPGRGRRGRPLAVLVAAVIPIILGGALLTGRAAELGRGRCAGSIHVSVAAAQEAVDVLRVAAAKLEQRGAEADGRCIDYRVHVAAPSEVSRSLDARAGSEPDLWVPDSSAWLDRIDGFRERPEVIVRSLARSPVVVAGPGLRQPDSWRQVLSQGDVSFINPLRSTAPVAALLAFRAEEDRSGRPGDLDRIMVPLAQRIAGDRDAPRNLDQLVLNPGGAAVLSEQQLLNRRAQGLGRDLQARVPKTGTLVLDYPLIALSRRSAVVEAADRLAGYLRNPAGTALLQIAGFRKPDLAPLPYGRGVGRVHVLSASSGAVVAGMLRHWSVLTVPSRILGVFDVSGSMDEPTGGGTRVSLASEACVRALGIFPDQTQVGVWAFSVGLGGPEHDYRELVRIRRLDAQVGGRSQRQLLHGVLAGLPALTSGGTGLYDTTLAAVRAMRSSYDRTALNTVVLLTDGRNEDLGSLTLSRLLRTLRRERDPARPVGIIAIGIGPDADAGALRQIVAATGGRSYVARDPTQLGAIFKAALLSR